MTLSVIVAASINNVIGINNQLPWHLPEDLRYFKAQTLGKPIVMGRKTFDSIGRPLPGRLNIVVTRQQDWQRDGVCVAHSLDEAKILASAVSGDLSSQEVMVIGGAELYREALELADKVYLTKVEISLDGDAFFPVLDDKSWRLVSEQPGDADASIAHRFLIFEKTQNI